MSRVTSLENVVWCTSSDAEFQGCRNLVGTLVTSNIATTWECKQMDTLQMALEETVTNTSAIHLMALDVVPAFHMGYHFDVKFIAAENNDPTNPQSYIDYYAVGITNKATATGKTGFSWLNGQGSCHSFYQDAGGWYMPIGWGVKEGVMAAIEAPATAEASRDLDTALAFFSTVCAPSSPFVPTLGSCEAGACNTTLCNASADTSGWTAVSITNREFNALQCLNDDDGLVAFVSGDVVKNLLPENYVLLCPDGTQGSPADYTTCNFGAVPTRSIVASQWATLLDVAEIWSIIESLTQDALFTFYFQTNPDNGLFSSNMVDLVNTPMDVKDFLKEDVYDHFEAITKLVGADTFLTQIGVLDLLPKPTPSPSSPPESISTNTPTQAVDHVVYTPQPTVEPGGGGVGGGGMTGSSETAGAGDSQNTGTTENTTYDTTSQGGSNMVDAKYKTMSGVFGILWGASMLVILVMGVSIVRQRQRAAQIHNPREARHENDFARNITRQESIQAMI